MILSFTGHRPNKVGEDGNPIPAGLVMLAADFLNAARPERCIVGMAQGWDMSVAYACTKLHIPFTAAIPFKGQQDVWPEHARALYTMLVNHSLATPHIVAPGGYSAGKMSLRNGWMVDNSDAVIALWDGSRGGTGNCVKYARMKGKPLLNLWPSYEGNKPTVDQLWRDFNDTLRSR